ncbi:g6653 [Coccomyxa viridis]|uniref:G6653 protein n=1 Tax=Coccomyxa viridis TaxID=1274662 RepID=A0ABP1G0U3_9CHLO
MMTKALMSPGEDLGPTTESQHPRNLLYVNDAVNAILLALDRGLDTGPLVVGGEETLTGNLAEAISTMTQRSGLKVAPNPAIARRGKHQSDGGSNADLETAQTVLGWKPSTALEAGLEATLPSVAHQMQQTKTLVILIGQARGGEMPWKSLHKHLLAPLDAHLALMFTDVQQPTVLLEWAQYVWSVPEYEDWSVVYDDAVASSCPSRHANATWRALCSLKGALFMGGIPDCQSPVWNSAGILLAMRWTIQQKIIEYELLSKYDWFILSRSDELYACEHPDVKGLDPAYAWLPEGTLLKSGAVAA